MSLISFDYVCTNKECSQEREDRIVRREKQDEQTCSKCSSPMSKCLSAPKGTHHSWSTWRVGIGLDK